MAGRRYKRKKKVSAFEDLYRWFLDVPVFAPMVVAAAVFAICALVLPASLHIYTGGWEQLGWILAALILIIGAGAQVGKVARRRLVASTHTLDDIAQRPWQDFERLMAEVFKLDGWAVSVVGTSARGRGDGGVDLILRRPGEAVAVQCKRVRGRVGVEKVRELQGALADFGALRGIFVTLGDFTQEAHDFATRRGMELITGPALVRMLPAAAAPSTEPEIPAPTCPTCGSPMLIRRSQRHGAFWGCDDYPHCHGWRTTDGPVPLPTPPAAKSDVGH